MGKVINNIEIVRICLIFSSPHLLNVLFSQFVEFSILKNHDLLFWGHKDNLIQIFMYMSDKMVSKF